MSNDKLTSVLAIVGVVFLAIICLPILGTLIAVVFDMGISLLGALFSLLFGILELIVSLLAAFLETILTLIEAAFRLVWFFIRRPTNYLARMVFGSEIVSRLYDRSRETIYRIRMKPRRTLAAIGGCLLLIGFVVVAAIVKLLTKPE